MTYGTSLNADYPTIGDSAATEAADLNTLLAAIVARLEGKVTTAGINIDANVEFNGFAITELASARFNAVTALASGQNAFFVNTANNELYYRNASGTNIQVTSSGALNVAGVSGITGSGYGTGSVEVNWDAGNTRYRMRSGSLTDSFASVALNDVQFNDGSGNFLTVGVPAMSADESITLPITHPAANSGLVVINSSGAMSYAVSFTPEGGTLTVVGTLAATGNITATTTITATGDVTGALLKHTSSVSHVVGMTTGHPAASAWAFANGRWVNTDASTAILYFSPMLPTGAVISEVRANVLGASGSPAVEMAFQEYSGDSLVATHGTDNSGGATDDTLSVTALAVTVTAARSYVVSFYKDASDASECRVYDLRFVYTTP